MEVSVRVGVDVLMGVVGVAVAAEVEVTVGVGGVGEPHGGAE